MVCAFVEPQAIGALFKRVEWPLHVTIVPWFRLKVSQEQFIQTLQKELSGYRPFKTEVTRPGHSHSGLRRLSLLKKESWQPIHETVLEIVLRHATMAVPLTFAHQHYRPHVTYQKHAHLNTGDTFTCDRLYIVEQKSDYKQITAEIIFGKS